MVPGASKGVATMIPAVILAAGNSTRIGQSTVNKVALPFAGKPMIVRAVESVKDIADPILVVVGAYKESVIDCLKDYRVTFIEQQQRLGTGNAVASAMPYLDKYNPDFVLVGYSDHMMLINSDDIKKIIDFHQNNHPIITVVTVELDNPFGLGRVIKNDAGFVTDIIEEKDALPDHKKIKLINTGPYIFNFQYLKNNISQLKIHETSGEYYLTDLVMIAAKQNLPVLDYQLDYKNIGGGVNTLEQLNQLESIASK